MASFQTHVAVGAIGGGLVAVVTIVLLDNYIGGTLLTLGTGIGITLTTLAGAIFPDIDHPQSIPRQKVVRGLQPIITGGVLAFGTLQFNRIESVIEHGFALVIANSDIAATVVAGSVIVVVAFLLGALLDPILCTITRRHRGWTHSLPVMAGLTIVLLIGVGVATQDLGQATQLASLLTTGSFFVGVVIHLAVDGELW